MHVCLPYLVTLDPSCCTVLMWTHANSHPHDCPRVYAGSRSGHAMQFYSWQQFRPVGPPMVEPKWVQWDPDVTVAALAYSDSLVLYRARPTFKAMASLSIQVQPAMPLLWHIASPGYNFCDGFALCRDLLTLTFLQQPAWGSMLFSGPAFYQMHEPAGILGVSSSM